MIQTIICIKWGNRYPSEYVNRLWSMIQRHTARPTRLVCYTEDPEGINEGVEIYPLPAIELPEVIKFHAWRKVSLWQKELQGIEGDVLFIDLDVVITGSLDEFFDYKPESTFCVIENWTQMKSKIGNTSVYRFRVGAHTYIYDKMQAQGLEMLKKYGNSQTFISNVINEKDFWPEPWCQSFKHTMMPAWPLNLIKVTPLKSDTKVVCFTGKPDPDEARDGIWKAPWYKRFYKHVKPTPWIAEHWQ